MQGLEETRRLGLGRAPMPQRRLVFEHTVVARDGREALLHVEWEE